MYFDEISRKKEITFLTTTNNCIILFQSKNIVRFNKFILRIFPMVAWAYLSDDKNVSILLTESKFEISQTIIKEPRLEEYRTLFTGKHYVVQILHPEISDREWLSLVK